MKKYLLLLLLPFIAIETSAKLREQIGQLIIAGFDGTEIHSQDAVSKAITKHNIGGVILFDVNTRRAIIQEDGSETPARRNINSPKQLRTLIQNLQAQAPTPLFIAVDQEGGRVSRLHPGNGFPETPSHKAFALESLESAHQAARSQAKILKDYGINLNLAPVVDLETPGNFIGAKERCFSSNPEVVAKYAQIYIRAHKEAGILCAAKHFPGHGSTLGDSHLGLVDGTATWTSKELIPYEKLIQENALDAILTGHLYIKQLDANTQSSLSSKTLTGLLRETMSYNGLIITDDLNMGAIENEYSLPEASVQALLAGNDILLICHTLLENPEQLETVIQTIEAAVQAGRLPQEQINASYKRVLKAKEDLGLIQTNT